VTEADALLAWWFGTATPGAEVPAGRNAFWFGGTAETDAACRARWGALLERACAGELDGWAATPRGRLALVILLDQLSRNVFRGTPRAFAQDATARALVEDAIAKGDDEPLAPIERVFLYLPLQHAEDVAAQEDAVCRYRRLAGSVPPDVREEYENYLRHAEQHRDWIARFGRFPQRNAALGRASTPEERSFLASLSRRA
jgi:uncharacterized protein (DUF924 family)